MPPVPELVGPDPPAELVVVPVPELIAVEPPLPEAVAEAVAVALVAPPAPLVALSLDPPHAAAVMAERPKSGRDWNRRRRMRRPRRKAPVRRVGFGKEHRDELGSSRRR